MRLAVIGCSMIRSDIEPLISLMPEKPDVFWLDEKLHESPKKLGPAIQEVLDSLTGYDEVILTYLLCGNALLGLHCDTAPIRFLKGDDCIYACMCLREDYGELRPRSLFTSRGWMNTGRNPLESYNETLKKYGPRRTKMIYDAMYRNYRHVVFMKLGDDEINDADRERTERFASTLGLDTLYLDGSTELYRKLLVREDGPEINLVEPGHVITLADTGIFG